MKAPISSFFKNGAFLVALFLLMFPLFFGIDNNFNVYIFSHDSNPSLGKFLPISVLILIWVIFLSNKLTFMKNAFVLYLTLLYSLAVFFSHDSAYRFYIISFAVFYFFIIGNFFEYLFRYRYPRIIVNGWFFSGILVSLILGFQKFGGGLGIGVFNYGQYSAPLIASFSFAILFVPFANLFYRIVLSWLFYICCYYILDDASSNYVQLSFFTSLLSFCFLHGLFFLRLNNWLITVMYFWIVNLIYLVFLFFPFHGLSTNFRDEILLEIFVSPESFLFPFLWSELVDFYSAHSYLFEGFRVFGILFLIINHFLLRAIYRGKSFYGTFISLHIFTVCGLFSMPQYHLYTIPLLLIFTHFDWQVSGKKFWLFKFSQRISN